MTDDITPGRAAEDLLRWYAEAGVDMALDDIECKDSICRFDTDTQIRYQDMTTNETWAISRGGGAFPGDDETIERHSARSRSVLGRTWKPNLFARS